MNDRLELVQRVEYIMKLCRGNKVLHLGCTDYPFTRQMIDNRMLLHSSLKGVAAELYGFDQDQQGLDILAAAGVDNLIQADLERLEEVNLDKTFDVIIAGEMIEHLSNPGLFLRGIKRFMDERTRLVITTINAYSGMRFVTYALRGRGGENEPVHPDHVAYYSYRTLRLVLQRERFDIEGFHFYDLGPEHRRYNRWIVNLVNDLSVMVSPQLSDGVIATCRLAQTGSKATGHN